MKGIFQRKRNDCGVAAIATVCGLSYDQVSEAWRASLGREPGLSHGKELSVVAGALGFSTNRNTREIVSPCIVRVRPFKGCNKSHWITVSKDGEVWCSELGSFPAIQSYPWQTFGHSLTFMKQ